MIVVADAGPIHYLILIAEIDLVRKIYGRVVIPKEVATELLHPSAPSIVKAWVGCPPEWVTFADSSLTIAKFADLDSGERAAIALAVELRADLLLIDDMAARRTARELGMQFTGTLGVLQSGALAGHVDLVEAIRRLMQTNFHASPSLLAAMLRGAGGNWP